MVFAGVIRMGENSGDFIPGIQQRLNASTTHIVISEDYSFHERSSLRRRFRLTNNTLNKVAGTGADIVIDASDILPEQPHADKLGTDEHEQYGKQHEHPSAAHCGPNTSRRNTSRKAKAKPSRAITLPKTLSRRSGVVVKQVTGRTSD